MSAFDIKIKTIIYLSNIANIYIFKILLTFGYYTFIKVRLISEFPYI